MHGYLCTKVLLRQLNDQDERDLNALRAFVNVTRNVPTVMNEVVAELMSLEVASSGTHGVDCDGVLAR